MRQILSTGICVLMLSVSAISAEPVTVTGTIVDLWCYRLNVANTERDHKGPAFQGAQRGVECASACVKWDGSPVGIVTADGKVYQFAGDFTADNNTRLAPHLGHVVTVSGNVYEKDGMTMLSGMAKDLRMAK